ncbi:MAG: 4-hydroxy-3-methylbut-2-enyl diphosphate reductase [Bacteroidetes bacterium HGW-Bacteroidetes-21]|jgi:4-hydroxy-3-methylbut-2-enyl diphosphate reductase|nr:MAG: 4-hydroxy-3-methylbut-2-enyl diphosphate reductase [Bacteroidetes bacterium HGW-Bacteroidetes-21]
MKIEIDTNSGFCFGVVNAIRKAEQALEKEDKLYCLGEIVHNNVELQRLSEKGLITINHDQFKELRQVTVLIRAHGEPPETYAIAKENDITLIDSTCPVVLRLQLKISKGYQETAKENGQIVIFGKEGHAEVNGLVGQTNNTAIVVNGSEDLSKIDFSLPITIFSQTTQDLEKYHNIIEEISRKIKNESLLNYNDTICRQVSNRSKELRVFARSHDVILFVSGKNSSNGKVLFEVCLNENPRTFFISSPEDLRQEWFKGIQSTGICGATSTPLWLMEKIAETIKIITI